MSQEAQEVEESVCENCDRLFAQNEYRRVEMAKMKAKIKGLKAQIRELKEQMVTLCVYSDRFLGAAKRFKEEAEEEVEEDDD